MSNKSRRIAMAKRVSLAEFFDGNQECYAIVRPCSRKEYTASLEASKNAGSPDEDIESQNSFVREHLLSGKISVIDESGTLSIADLIPEDISAETLILSNRLYYAITGLKYDPKDS